MQFILFIRRIYCLFTFSLAFTVTLRSSSVTHFAACPNPWGCGHTWRNLHVSLPVFRKVLLTHSSSASTSLPTQVLLFRYINPKPSFLLSSLMIELELYWTPETNYYLGTIQKKCVHFAFICLYMARDNSLEYSNPHLYKTHKHQWRGDKKKKKWQEILQKCLQRTLRISGKGLEGLLQFTEWNVSKETQQPVASFQKQSTEILMIKSTQSNSLICFTLSSRNILFNILNKAEYPSPWELQIQCWQEDIKVFLVRLGNY